MRNLKKLSVLLIAGTIVSCSGNKTSNQGETSSESQQENQASVTDVPAIKKYQIKSGIVTFDNDLMGVNQKTMLYFDDYGMKEAEVKYEGEDIRETTFCDGKDRFIVIHKEKTAYTSGTCYRGIAYKFDWDEISKSDPKYKVKKLANTSVAGKDCESYSMESNDYPTVFAGWNNICLLMESTSKFGKVVMKAVKVEENASIPATVFKVPEGYEIKKGI